MRAIAPFRQREWDRMKTKRKINIIWRWLYALLRYKNRRNFLIGVEFHASFSTLWNELKSVRWMSAMEVVTFGLLTNTFRFKVKMHSLRIHKKRVFCFAYTLTRAPFLATFSFVFFFISLTHVILSRNDFICHAEKSQWNAKKRQRNRCKLRCKYFNTSFTCTIVFDFFFFLRYKISTESMLWTSSSS